MWTYMCSTWSTVTLEINVQSCDLCHEGSLLFWSTKCKHEDVWMISFSVPASCPQGLAQRRSRRCSLSSKLMRLVSFQSFVRCKKKRKFFDLWPWAAGVEAITFIFSAALLCFRLLMWIPDLQPKTSATVSPSRSIGKTRDPAVCGFRWISTVGLFLNPVLSTLIGTRVGCSFSASRWTDSVSASLNLAQLLVTMAEQVCLSVHPRVLCLCPNSPPGMAAMLTIPLSTYLFRWMHLSVVRPLCPWRGPVSQASQPSHVVLEPLWIFSCSSFFALFELWEYEGCSWTRREIIKESVFWISDLWMCSVGLFKAALAVYMSLSSMVETFLVDVGIALQM